MDNVENNLANETRYRHLWRAADNSFDKPGPWLALTLIFFVLVVGTIIYRADDSAVRTASIDVFPPYTQIEGFDR